MPVVSVCSIVASMADRKKSGTRKPGGGGASAPRPRVIDVGEPENAAPEDADAETAEAAEPADDDESVADLLTAAGAQESADSGEDLDEPAPLVKSGRSLAVRDPLGAYMTETRRYPLLTPDEEHALAVRLVEQHDSAAARRLIEANLRLVVKIAYEYRRTHKNLLDLVQEGNIGLIQAVRKYDPYRGVRLASYAGFWIRAYILRFLLNNSRLVRVGTTQAQRKLFFNLRKERDKLEAMGFQPTAAMLAERLDVPEREVVDMQHRLSAPDTSLDAPLSTDGEGSRSRLDYLESDAPSVDSMVASSEVSELLRSKLRQFASTLEGRELTIFQDRLLSEDPVTLQDIGNKFGLSRERVRQLEHRMLGRLKTFLEKELGSAVDIAALTRE
jgi:RNA polymerase sigma-32 factor